MRNQQGLTLIGMLLTLMAVVIIGILILKVTPVYIEHYSVIKSANSLNTLPAEDFGYNSSENMIVLKKKLISQLYINGVDELVKNGISIKPKDQFTYVVTIKYQVVEPLIFNANLLFKFDDSIEVNIAKN